MIFFVVKCLALILVHTIRCRLILHLTVVIECRCLFEFELPDANECFSLFTSNVVLSSDKFKHVVCCIFIWSNAKTKLIRSVNFILLLFVSNFRYNMGDDAEDKKKVHRKKLAGE